MKGRVVKVPGRIDDPVALPYRVTHEVEDRVLGHDLSPVTERPLSRFPT